MSEAERIEGLFKKVSAFPDFMEVATIANDCIDTVRTLEHQLAEAKKENTELMIKFKAHKKESLTVTENIKFRELKEQSE